MINKLKPKSEFTRNVLTLMTGTTIAQAIPIAISPILTRIYTPEDFGVLSLFVAISAIFSSISTGRYELAIMLPKKDKDAINIFALGVIIVSFISLLLFLLIVIFHDNIIILLHNREIGFWLYLSPVAVFFMGMFNLLSYFNNKIKRYKDIANATIIKSIALVIIQLLVGFLKNGATGLISGQIFSQMFANIRLLENIIINKQLLSSVTTIKMIALAKKYINFPKFSLTGSLASTLSVHMINILIISFYSIATLGFYSMVQRVLAAPSALIGTSIGKVFFQKAIEEKHMYGNCINTFKSTIKKLIIISLPLYLFLFLIVEDLFAFIFGEEWRIAGEYAKIVMPVFFISFISTSLSMVYDIFEQLKLELVWKLIFLFGITIFLYLIHNLNYKFEVFLYIYSIYASVMYTISSYLTWKISHGKGFLNDK